MSLKLKSRYRKSWKRSNRRELIVAGVPELRVY